MDRAVLGGLRDGRRVVVLSVAAGLLAALARIALAGLLARVVTEAFLAHREATGPLIAFALVAVLHACLQGMREALAQGALSTGKAELRRRLIAHLLRLGPARLRGDQTGELAAVAGEGIERLDPCVTRYLPQVALSVLVPLAIGAAVATQDWISAVILLATAPVLPLLMVLVGKYAEGHIQRQWEALARMSAHFLDMVQGLTTLKAFGRGAAARESVRRVSLAYRDRTLSTLRYAFLSGLVLEFITAGAIALVAVSLGIRLLAGGIGFERAFFVLLLTPEFYRPLRELGQHRHAAMEARAPAERIGALLAQEGTAPVAHGPATAVAWQKRTTAVGGFRGQVRPAGPRTAGVEEAPAFTPGSGSCPRGAASGGLKAARGRDEGGLNPAARPADEAPRPEGAGFQGGPATVAGWYRNLGSTQPAIRLAGPLRIACRGVGYVYQDGAHPALAGVDLVLEPGRRTALVGRSGAGKTTLLYLLLRFVEPTAGSIEVNGVGIGVLPAETWRAHLAYVPQRPHLFAGSIRENIALGRSDAGMDAVATAARLAGADRFIERLPQGYDTAIGERGLRLSGGEAQRISLARAFLKDAPVLLLDEPTSHLDPAGESLIREALEQLMEGRTVLIAAHRLNTVRAADRIVVLEGGRVVEQGMHSELAARGGPYARMVGERQAVAGR